MGIFIESKRLLIIAVSGILIVAALFGATQLKLSTGVETYLSTDSQAYQDYTKFNQHFGSSVVVVLVTGNDLTQLLQPANMTAMETVENQMGTNPNVISALGPVFFIKQAVAQQTGTPALPLDPQILQSIVVDSQNGQIRPQFNRVLPDDQHALIAIVLKGDLSLDDQKLVSEEVENIVATAGFSGVEAVVTGLPAVFGQLEDMMSSSLLNMFLFSILLMLVILAVVFSVRGFFAWRWLPLGIVLIGIIYTFGIMGMINVPITMVTMAVFPILIGLGVDYAIQFHNRYDEEVRRGETVAEAIIDSVTHIGPSIGIAIIAASLGFAALFFSPVPMVRDFGLMLIIGVIATYLVALFLLLGILYLHDRRNATKTPINGRKAKAKQDKVGFVERGLGKLAPWVTKNTTIIISLALLLTIGGLISDSHIATETDETKFISQDFPAVKNLLALEKITGGVSSINMLIESKDITDPLVIAWMVQLEQRIILEQPEFVTGTTSITNLILQATGGVMPQSSVQVKQILGQLPVPIKRNLITDDYTTGNLVISIKQLEIAKIQEVRDQLTGYVAPPPGVNVILTGTPIIGIELFNALTDGRVQMTLIGVGLIFLVLFGLFKFNLPRAVLAVLPIGLILGWSSGVMYLLGIKYTPLTSTLGALILGIGVEFTILLMMRYYEERRKGEGPEEAMATAMTKIGRAIIASGLTVIGGFGALLIAKDFLILRDFGIVTMINVFFALVSTLFVLPTLIVWVDTWQEKRRLVVKSIRK
ncbi:hydrophobe/amphiphile efflux-3 (HAE3) family transporter [Dehalogenimonas sp. THU2]|uniref:efflux RND transporter permease subunit n=1 Tax=Dehalogenimonas sp. THU2 TaxID=3151121 RepID=UPI0032186218